MLVFHSQGQSAEYRVSLAIKDGTWEDLQCPLQSQKSIAFEGPAFWTQRSLCVPLQIGYQPHRSPAPSQTKPTWVTLLYKRWNPLELLYHPPHYLQASHLEQPSGDFSPDERSKACDLLWATIRFRVMVRILAPPGEQTMEGSCPFQSV